jgi:hypothetical protein
MLFNCNYIHEASDEKINVSDVFGRMEKETLVCFKVLTYNMPEGTEENYINFSYGSLSPAENRNRDFPNAEQKC